MNHLLLFIVINTIIGHGHAIEEVLCTFSVVLTKLEILLLFADGYFTFITLSFPLFICKSIINLIY